MPLSARIRQAKDSYIESKPPSPMSGPVYY